MLYYYQSCRRYPKPCRRVCSLIIFSLIIGLFWTILTRLFFDIDDNDTINIEGRRRRQSPEIFCFVLSANNHHLTSSRAIVYSWGKRCDRFYFVTRLQNTSVELMMLTEFENHTDITPTTIVQTTLQVLLYLQREQLFASYHWFLRASDDRYVVVPNLRRLVSRLDREQNHQPIVYAGDVKEMYEKYQFSTSGSVMLFNRQALDRLVVSNLNCFENLIYDHEFVGCIEEIGMDVNSIDDRLILSQNLSTYRMDKRLKDLGCSPDTVAFRANNETDMFKFDFFYHHLDAKSRIPTY